MEVWPSPDVGWPVVPTAHADVVPLEYRGVIPDELLVPAQDVTLLKWLGKGCDGDVFKALVHGKIAVVKVRCRACPFPRAGAVREPGCLGDWDGCGRPCAVVAGCAPVG